MIIDALDLEKYFEMAIDEMKNSVMEYREDNKAVPKVGAVIVWKDGDQQRVTSAHRGELRNGDHAEYTLLDRKLRDKNLTGAVLFATLEPCAKGARRPPKCSCSERIVNARISKVYFGILDPDPKVAGMGKKHLEDNGLQVEMFPKEYQRIIEKENEEFLKQARIRADEKKQANKKVPDANISISDLDDGALNYYGHTLGIVSKDQIIEHLVDHGLIFEQDGTQVPTTDCLILFGKDPCKANKSAYIAIKRKGAVSSGDSLSYIKCPMVLAISEAKKWYLQAFPKLSYDDSMQRSFENQPMFQVFREALVNAIMHRDYMTDSGSIMIEVSDSLLKIKSPGKPEEPITLDEMNAFQAPALARNPAFAFIFRELGLSENMSHGMDMLGMVQSEGLVKPHYSFDGVYLTLSIPLEQKSLSEIYPDMKVLSDAELREVVFIRSHEQVTKSQLSEFLGVSEKTAQRHLIELMKKGFVVGNGESKKSKKYAYMISPKYK